MTFEQYYQNEHRKILRFCNQLTKGNFAWAEDIAQGAWLQAWKGWGQFQGNCKFSTWVCRIAYHEYLSFFRNKARTMQQDLERLPELVFDYPKQWEAKIDIESLLKNCRPLNADILRRCYLEDSLPRPISSNDKLKLFRAKQDIRKRLAA